MRDLPAAMSAANTLVDYKLNKPSGDDENVSLRTKAKTSRKKIARRTRISRRKIGVTKANERVLPLNKVKKNPS